MLNIAIFLFRAPVFCSFLEGICPFFLSSRGTKSEVSPLLSSSFPGPRRPVISHSLAGPRIVVRGDPVCSFFSAARRTNQEVPPLLSGILARSLSPPSGAAELAVLKQSSPFFLGRLASSRPDKGGVCFVLAARLRLMWLRSFRTFLVILRCDAVLHVIPRLDAVSRKYGRGIPAKAIPTSGTFLAPASLCGVTATSYRALTRYPGIPGKGPFPFAAPLWPPHRGAG